MNKKYLQGYEDLTDYEENEYQIKKEEAREEAVAWQLKNCDKCLSYGELAYYGEYFRKLGKRYGLLKEFRENGIC